MQGVLSQLGRERVMSQTSSEPNIYTHMSTYTHIPVSPSLLLLQQANKANHDETAFAGSLRRCGCGCRDADVQKRQGVRRGPVLPRGRRRLRWRVRLEPADDVRQAVGQGGAVRWRRRRSVRLLPQQVQEPAELPEDGREGGCSGRVRQAVHRGSGGQGVDHGVRGVDGSGEGPDEVVPEALLRRHRQQGRGRAQGGGRSGHVPAGSRGRAAVLRRSGREGEGTGVLRVHGVVGDAG